MEQQNQNVGVQNSPINIVVKNLGVILSVFVFLLPVFFVPAVSVNLYVAKITLLATGLVVVFAVFLSSVLSTGSIEIPKAKYLIPMGIFGLVSLASSVFSGSINTSVVGGVFDLGSSGFILMLIFALFLVILAVKNVGVINKVVSFATYSAIALSAYTIFGSFSGSLLPQSVASKLPLFLAGGAIDTAIVLGIAVILSMCALNMGELSKRIKIILSLLMVYSMIFIGAVNFVPVIVVLGLVSLVFFVYVLSWSVGIPDGVQSNQNHRKISFSSLAVFVVAVVLILGGTGVSGYLSKIIKVQASEIRPNFETTMNLTMESWNRNFALGVGPNRFVEFWSAHKPLEINQTQFWNTDFYSGSGFVPTIAITTGLLGLLSLLAFIGMYIMSGVKPLH